jgi:hypothetical protein
MRLSETTAIIGRKDLGSILRLPQLDPTALSRVSDTSIHRTLKVVFGVLLEVLSGVAGLPPPPARRPGRQGRSTRSSAWAKGVFVLLSYYDVLLRAVLARQDRDSVARLLYSAFDVELMRAFRGGSAVKSPHPESNLALGAFIDYQSTVLAVSLNRMFEDPEFDDLRPYIDSVAHRGLAGIHGIQNNAKSPDIQEMARYLLASALDTLRASYRRRARLEDEGERGYGPFSLLRINELSALARRGPAVLRTYGAGNVASRFEQQLSLLVQSFGLFVIPSRRGERTVDLICLSNDPTTPLSFLLEAKSTARPYALPSSDSRALAEYIENVSNSIAPFPQLAFVLLVGPVPSRTLAEKLLALQARAGLPLRYCEVATLARLRQALPGQLPTRTFADAVIRGAAVLPDNFIDRVIERDAAIRRASVEHVRVILGLDAPTHPRLS